MAQEQPIRIILIDDHSWVHEIIVKILATEANIELVAHGYNGEQALALCESHHPDLVLMDVVMPHMGGIEAAVALREKCPEIKILVLSSFRDDDSVHAMLESGAAGYVLKDSLADDLANTIRITHMGKAVFSPEVSKTLFKREIPQAKYEFELTRREQEVLRFMAAGLNNPEIAEKLVISRSTVKFHISNILYKMNVETRAEAITLAAKHNLT